MFVRKGCQSGFRDFGYRLAEQLELSRSVTGHSRARPRARARMLMWLRKPDRSLVRSGADLARIAFSYGFCPEGTIGLSLGFQPQESAQAHDAP
jgi:hypothetical protein